MVLVFKNCVEWIIVDLVIWVVGGVSVLFYLILLVDFVCFIFEYSEFKLLFVGKLDDWGMMKDGVFDGIK